MLDIPARNPREYSRILLKTLFQPYEFQSCLLPSMQAKRFSKPDLDAERFNLLNGISRFSHSSFSYGQMLRFREIESYVAILHH